MNLYSLIASVVWAAVALYAVRLCATILDRRTNVPPKEEIVVVPLDLQAFVARFTSDWAKADAMKTIREKYELSRDWNAVRRAVGLGTMDNG